MNNKPFLKDGIKIEWVEKLYGWGVFTEKDIPAYEVIETCPVFVYPADILKIAAWNTQDSIHAYKSLGITLYSIRWGDDSAAIPLGYGGMYNHSDNNNCQFLPNQQEGFLHIVSVKEIKAGEQLFVSYGQDWFNDKPFPKLDL